MLGPIIRLYDGVMKVLGTASGIMGKDKCAVRSPVFYTQVTDHLSWILSFSDIPGEQK